MLTHGRRRRTRQETKFETNDNENTEMDVSTNQTGQDQKGGDKEISLKIPEKSQQWVCPLKRRDGVNKSQEKKFETNEMKMPGRMSEVTKPDKIRNEVIRDFEEGIGKNPAVS